MLLDGKIYHHSNMTDHEFAAYLREQGAIGEYEHKGQRTTWYRYTGHKSEPVAVIQHHDWKAHTLYLPAAGT